MGAVFGLRAAGLRRILGIALWLEVPGLDCRGGRGATGILSGYSDY